MHRIYNENSFKSKFQDQINIKMKKEFLKYLALSFTNLSNFKLFDFGNYKITRLIRGSNQKILEILGKFFF